MLHFRGDTESTMTTLVHSTLHCPQHGVRQSNVAPRRSKGPIWSIALLAIAGTCVARPAWAFGANSGDGRLLAGMAAVMPLVVLQLGLASLFDWCYGRNGQRWRLSFRLLLLATAALALALTWPTTHAWSEPAWQEAVRTRWRHAVLAAAAVPAAVLVFSRGTRGWVLLFAAAQTFVLQWFATGAEPLPAFYAVAQVPVWPLLVAHAAGQRQRMARHDMAQPRWTTLAGIVLGGWFLVWLTALAAHEIGLPSPWHFDLVPLRAVREREELMAIGPYGYGRLYGLWADYLALHAVWTLWLTVVAVRRWRERRQ